MVSLNQSGVYTGDKFLAGDVIREKTLHEASSCLSASLTLSIFLPHPLPSFFSFSSAGGINDLIWDLPFTTPTSCNTAFAIIIADVGPPIVQPQPGVFGHL